MKPNGLRLIIVSQGYASPCLEQYLNPDRVLGVLPISVRRLSDLGLRAYRRQHYDDGRGNASVQRYQLSGFD
jgi:hypothetical protein